MNITLSNDNQIANPQPIVIQTILPKGDYAETDNCGFSLETGQQLHHVTISIYSKVLLVPIPGSQSRLLITVRSSKLSLHGFGQ